MAEPNPAETGEVTTLWVGDLVSAPTCRVSSCPARQPPIFLFQPGFLAKRRVGSNVDAASDARGRSPPSPASKTRDPGTSKSCPPFPRVSRRETSADVAIVPQSSVQGYWMEESYLHTCFAHFGDDTRQNTCSSSSLFFARATSGRRGASRVPSRARERVDARGKSSAGIGRADRAARPRRAPAPRQASPRSPRPRSAHLENTVAARSRKNSQPKTVRRAETDLDPAPSQARSGA